MLRKWLDWLAARKAMPADASDSIATPSVNTSNIALEKITQRVMRAGNPEDRKVPTPLLSLEEFFDGNDFVGSIGCNLDACPSPSDFKTFLNGIRDRPDVSDIRIQITCVDDPGNDWPFSDTIWIMTSAKAEEVKTWFPDELAPDAVWENWIGRHLYEPCPIRDGHKPVAVWYD